MTTPRFARLSFALAAISCSAPPAPPPRAAVKIPAPATASAMAAPPPEGAHIAPTPRGRAGWFETFDDSKGVMASWISDGKCLAVAFGHRWLVSPDPTVDNPFPTVCDGNATELPPLPTYTATPVGFGRHVAYYDSFAPELLVSDSPEAEPESIETPFKGVRDAKAAGATLLVIAETTGKLYRLDGKTLQPIVLDGSKVESLAGTPAGEAFAITSNHALYSSSDSGRTWKPLRLGFTSVNGFAHSSRYVDSDLYVSGKAKLDAAHGGHANAGPEDAESLIATRAGPRVFYGVHIRTKKPEGVVDPFGVDLAAKSIASESLTSGRKCTATEVRGSFAAAACDGDKVRSIFFSDDLGATVREIYREPIQGNMWVERIVIGDGDLMLVRACVGGGCGDHRLTLLSEQKDAWTAAPLHLPTAEAIAFPQFDRRPKGGYFFVAPVPVAGDEHAWPVTNVFHTRGTEVANVELTTLFGTPQEKVRMAIVQAATVADDGGLGVVVTLDPHERDVRPTGYVHISERLRLSSERLFDPDSVRNGYAKFGIAGPNVVALFGSVASVSSDGGAKFEKFELPFGVDTEKGFVCGQAGCDFGGGYRDTVSIWRWGDKPLRETANPAR